MKTNAFFKLLALSLVVGAVPSHVQAMLLQSKQDPASKAVADAYVKSHGESCDAALIAAVKAEDKALVAELVCRPDLDKKKPINKEGESLLHYAYYKTSGFAIERLLSDHGFELNEKEGNIENFLRAAEENVSAAQAKEQYGCDESDVDLVRRLLANRLVPVNVLSPCGQTALHWAVYCGNAEIVGELLVHGADVHIRGRAGWTPLHETASNNINFHSYHWADGTETIGKVDTRSICVPILMAEGADINARDNRGRTPLYLAVGHVPTWVNVALIRALLDAGADVTIPDNAGKTPLQIAEQYNNQDVKKMLQDAIADPVCNGWALIKLDSDGDGAADPDHDPDCNDWYLVDSKA